MNEHLIDLGFAFKKSQIWKTVFEEELFAVRLPDELKLSDGSEFVYCAIMGRDGEHRAIAVYMGNRGFASLRAIHQGIDHNVLEEVLCQDCLQCSLERDDQFRPEDLELIKAEAKKRKARAPYPQFSRFSPNCIPWYITDPNDLQILTLALEITMAMAQYLQNHDKSEIHLRPLAIQSTREKLGNQMMMESLLEQIDEDENNQRIPVMAIRNGELIVEDLIPLPGPYQPEYPKATLFDELRLKSLQKIPKDAILECEVVRIPEPTREESGDGAPYLPAILLSVDEDGMVRLPVMMRRAVYDPNEAVNDFLRGMIEEKCRPKKIYVRTEETMSLLEEFCRKAGIKLVREENLELLEEARETMLERFQDEEDDNEEGFGLNEIIKMLENIPDRELRTMPEFMIHQIIEMADSGMLPEHIVQKIRRNFK